MSSAKSQAQSQSQSQPQPRVNWGDVDLDDESQPENRIRSVTEMVTNEKGQKLKVTRQLKRVKKPTRVNRHVQARRQWPKFGDCTDLPAGPETNVTYTSFEVINLDLRPKKREEEKEESGLDKLQGSSSIVVCRNCGETGHWTLKCPKRSQIVPFATGGASAPADGSADPSKAAAAAAVSSTDASGKYIPLHLRNAEENKRGLSSLRDAEGKLRVTNLSEDVTENDLADLFRRFGQTSRIYLAKDHQTGLSRGFAFVNFTSRSSAQAAIDKLNGHGYDNLILHVEWAKAREEKEGERQ